MTLTMKSKPTVTLYVRKADQALWEKARTEADVRDVALSTLVADALRRSFAEHRNWEGHCPTCGTKGDGVVEHDQPVTPGNRIVALDVPDLAAEAEGFKQGVQMYLDVADALTRMPRKESR